MPRWCNRENETVMAEPAAERRPIKRLSGISSWHPDCYQRAVAYLTDPAGRLLVFDHVDVDAGTQVPAGPPDGLKHGRVVEHLIGALVHPDRDPQAVL